MGSEMCIRDRSNTAMSVRMVGTWLGELDLCHPSPSPVLPTAPASPGRPLAAPQPRSCSWTASRHIHHQSSDMTHRHTDTRHSINSTPHTHTTCMRTREYDFKSFIKRIVSGSTLGRLHNTIGIYIHGSGHKLSMWYHVVLGHSAESLLVLITLRGRRFEPFARRQRISLFGKGDHHGKGRGDLHYPLRRQRQMCIRDRRNTPSLYAGSHCCFCLLYTSPSPRDGLLSRMPSSA